MESGTAPWRKPWTGAVDRVCFPLRSTGAPYQGINVLMLWIEASERGYTSAHWFTYKQAADMGGQVRKGEKSATVVKYGTFEKEDSNGKDRAIPFLKAYRVFNADQIDGLPAEFYGIPTEPPRDLGTEANPELDAFFAATGAKIEISTEARAYYNSTADFIHMPPVATFRQASGFYSTLAHEACHWTGHKSRLDRLSMANDRKAYAFEELIAEIGNCMVCASLGIAPDFDQSGAYIKGWLEALSKDTRLIFKAASEAQKAMNYLLDAAKPEKVAQAA
jgi:antirestriction protein ArdC